MFVWSFSPKYTLYDPTSHIVCKEKNDVDEVGKFEISVAYTDFSADSGSGLDDEDHIVGTISTSF